MGEGIKNKFRLLCFLLKVDYEFFTQEQGGTRTPTENEAPFLADSLVPGQLSRLCGVPRDGTFLITYTHAAASRDDYKSSRAPPSKVITAWILDNVAASTAPRYCFHSSRPLYVLSQFNP